MRSRLLRTRSLLIVILIIMVIVAIGSESQFILAENVTSLKAEGAPSADCAVVLTGGAGRVREGIDLLYRGVVNKLIISGVNSGSPMREVIPQLAFYGNIKEEDIILERHSGTTYGNAVQSLPLVQALQCKSILLVTSRIHMARAYRTFHHIFPASIHIEKYAVLGGRAEVELDELMVEVFKSFFYSVWAYS